MVSDKLKVTGEVAVYLNGVLSETHNLVVDSGKAWIAARMAGVAPLMSHMAIGSNDGSASAGQVALGAELVRKALTVDGGEVSANVVTYKCTYSAAEGTGVVKEAALFNADSAGTMLSRSVIGPYTKGPKDVLSIVWTVTVS